ncbi:MAG: class I SAM-dependent methyltransferase [Actinomycetia bacterium]|nr:class I SAM-dependent methyltransferase [Actinomycetes bacterium]
MTIWDNIYKNYQKNGEAWASLSEEIHPLFKKFMNKSNFKLKYALDIGCGTGKYLSILQNGGFKTDGIDSSKTAIEIAKEVLGAESKIVYVDMFQFNIPKNQYDLVISVSTIHHGIKEQIQILVDRIYEAIIKNGKIFISVPDLKSSKKWETFKDYKEIAEGTLIPLSGPEKGLPHSFYTKEDVLKMVSKFKDIKIELDEIGRWVIQASK